MSKHLAEDQAGRIVNPFAKTVLTLEAKDDGSVNLQAPTIPPQMVFKILSGIMIDLMFQSHQAAPPPENGKSYVV